MLKANKRPVRVLAVASQKADKSIKVGILGASGYTGVEVHYSFYCLIVNLILFLAKRSYEIVILEANKYALHVIHMYAEYSWRLTIKLVFFSLLDSLQIILTLTFL